MKKYLLISVMILFSFYGNAQNYKISGHVEDSESGEKLAGASVYVKESAMLNTISDASGFYSLTIPAMKLHLVCSYKAYKTQTFAYELNKDTVINFSLMLSSLEEKPQVLDNQMSKHSLKMDMIKSTPLLLSENDVIKTIHLLPGVQYGAEGTSSIYVRGGGADQNQILYDGVPVYNISHLGGISSIFNEDITKGVSLLKGGFPAVYGGRLSSVVDVEMKEGNKKKFGGAYTIGLLSAKLTFQGPIIKDKTSFIISYRRSWLDLITKPLIKIISDNNESGESAGGGFYFWDFNAKINHKLSDKDKIYLSLYAGKDNYNFDMEKQKGDNVEIADYSLFTGNLNAAFGWKHSFGKKIRSNTMFAYTKYKFTTSLLDEKKNNTLNFLDYKKWDYKSGIDDFNAKIDYNYLLSRSHNIKFGFSYIYHTFRPGENILNINSEQESSVDSTFGYSNLYSSEYAIYVQDEIAIGKKLTANIGIHYSGFKVDDTLFQSVQPRISARLLFSEKFSVKAAFSQMTQYLHMLTNTSIGLPTDLWLPVTKNIFPQKSTQYSLGFYYSPKKGIDFSIEGYYKEMKDLIDYKEGASFFNFAENVDSDNRAWEKNIEKEGAGESYGVEFLVRKTTGKTTGWLGYTYSQTWRKFDDINLGEKYPFTYDRRHDLSLVLLQKIGKKFEIGLNWVFGTGNAFTLPLEQYEILSDESGENNDFVENAEHRNNYRMPSYHRMDLAFNFPKQKKRGKRTFSINIYNVYNRQNPYFLMLEEKDNLKVLKQYSILPIIPSISYKFEF